EDVGVADGLDAAEGLQLLLGALAVVAGGGEVAEDELDGLEEAAGGLALPDLAEAAAAEALDEPVFGDRLGVAFDPARHGCIPGVTSRRQFAGLRRRSPPGAATWAPRRGPRRGGERPCGRTGPAADGGAGPQPRAGPSANHSSLHGRQQIPREETKSE